MTYTLSDLHARDPWLVGADVRTYLEGLYPGIQLSAEQMEDFLQNSDRPPPAPTTDTRPLINKEWIEQNPERWEELNIKPECCPVCLETDVNEWRGQLLCKSEQFTRNRKCTHWFCSECFVHICRMSGARRRRCPMCKDQWWKRSEKKTKSPNLID